MLLGEFDPYFVCDDCANGDHDECVINDDLWCDCQHKPRKQ